MLEKSRPDLPLKNRLTSKISFLVTSSLQWPVWGCKACSSVLRHLSLATKSLLYLGRLSLLSIRRSLGSLLLPLGPGAGGVGFVRSTGGGSGRDGVVGVWWLEGGCWGTGVVLGDGVGGAMAGVVFTLGGMIVCLENGFWFSFFEIKYFNYPKTLNLSTYTIIPWMTEVFSLGSVNWVVRLLWSTK